MNDSEYSIGNRLLAALSDADWQRWKPQLERIDLKFGEILYQPGKAPRHAYFPTSAIVSLGYILSNGSSTGFSIVGNEGIVGVSLFMANTSTTGYGSVLIAGQGFRIGAQMIREEFDRSDSVRLLLLRYTQALVTQIAQAAICNRHHTVDQHLCGWLLHCLDRLRDSEVAVTQEHIASMLGVRRESVTEAAGRLEAAGLIRCWRGHIAVLDRGGIERRTCECHGIVKQEYDRLLPQDRAARPAAPRRRAVPASDINREVAV